MNNSKFVQTKTIDLSANTGLMLHLIACTCLEWTVASIRAFIKQ
jgi:hypothetical protein